MQLLVVKESIPTLKIPSMYVYIYVQLFMYVLPVFESVCGILDSTIYFSKNNHMHSIIVAKTFVSNETFKTPYFHPGIDVCINLTCKLVVKNTAFCLEI